MKWTTALIIGGVAILITILVGYFITRWGVFEEESEDTDGAERISREPQQERRRIPLRDKPRQLTFPMKVLVFSMFIIGIVISFYSYQFLKQGSPVEFQYALEAQFGLVGVLGVWGGVYLKDWAEGRIGKVHVDYEETDESSIDKTGTIYFLTQETEPRDEGTIKVKSLFPGLILRLFPRRKLAGHDSRLRGDRPLGKRVTYEIPKHGVVLDDGEYYVRTQGERVVGGAAPDGVDIRFRPPYQLPYKAYVAQRERLEKKETRMNSMKAQLAQAHNELRDLERTLRNSEYQTREEVLDEIERVQQVTQPSYDEITLQQARGGRLGREQRPRSQQQHHEQRNGDGGDKGA